ncbi:MAG: 16S rRNA (guanine(527)-N(7))-methyltransferase RsmG [Candidatus Sumerlaeaceae bacterium]
MRGLDSLPVELQEKFAALSHLLLEGQKRLNLTAIKEPAAIKRLHFLDSLAGLEAFPELMTVTHAADVGSGAGFPLLPLAILTPGCHWIALESVAKKARFIEETAQALGLTNVEARPLRAEDAARTELRGSQDVVTARAVGPVASLCEVGLPLLKPGGTLLLYKTETALAETAALQSSIAELGGTALPAYRYRLEGDLQQRVILRLCKTAETPEKYPRAAGVPFKKPLSA